MISKGVLPVPESQLVLYQIHVGGSIWPSETGDHSQSNAGNILHGDLLTLFDRQIGDTELNSCKMFQTSKIAPSKKC